MAHTMVYGIAGGSVSNLASLKSAGFVDFHYVVPGGSAPTSASGFVSQCNSLGVSPILNNGNDGIPGASGYDYNSYYQTVAGLGWHAAGGESEPASECSAIMSHLPFMNYGGEYGGCGNNFSDIFAHGSPSASGSGIASYLETYIGVAGIGLCPNEVVAAMVSAKNHGCKEVGIMIGNWMSSYGATAQSYISIINAYEAASGSQCAGVVLWGGYGQSMEGVYNNGSSASIIQTLRATWPSNMTTLKNRFAGVTPTPTPTPVVNSCEFVLVHETLCSVCQQQQAILTQMKSDYPQITVTELLDSGADLTTLQTKYPDTYTKFTSCGLVPVTGVYNGGKFITAFCNLQTEDALKTACGSSGGVTPVTPVGTLFTEMSNFNLVPYLTKKHDGQPTPGIHKIIIYPYGTVAINAVASAQVREYQPGNQ